MSTLIESPAFQDWMERLSDAKGKACILARLAGARAGNFGDCEPVGDGVSEMRVQYGPGYRVYFIRDGLSVYVLLCGGDKGSQKRDIAKAKENGAGAEGGRAMSRQYREFDASAYLDSEEAIAEYLSAAAEDDNPEVLLLAIADVAKARGMAQVAKDAGLGRESLYKALAPGAHPRYATIAAVLKALGVRLAISAAQKEEPA